jgi:hypothetical protein
VKEGNAVGEIPDWDPSQLHVITQPPSKRLIVDAGPGTGKTAVACARVAHLINMGGVPARGVWLISFTRTAVKEIRDRIRAYLLDPDALYAVRIATVDAHAWSIHQGFSPNASLTGSFDDNIARVIELIERDDDTGAYIEETDHLVVDEAQDLVGVRADLIVRLVGRLRPDAGVTVFADEAQAIYGFAEDAEQDGPAADGISLTARLAASERFTRASLNVVHRTKSANLLGIFTNVRAMVVAPGAAPSERLENVRAAIAGQADRNMNRNFDPENPGRDGVFVLFRRRSEVLQASAFLCQRQVPHRLRMSGLPAIIPPWIGAVLGDFTQPHLTKDEFFARCARNAGPSAIPADPERAWALLESHARGARSGIVDLRRLRTVLGRVHPPVDIVSADYGASGPILGTIHAAKGRETDDVMLMLPPTGSGDDDEVDLDEEARVIFVGATRARKSLAIGRGYTRLIANNLETSGRVFALLLPAGKARIELGRAGDITASGVVGRAYLPSGVDAHALQLRLASLETTALAVRADCDRNAEFAYRLSAVESDASIGMLSQIVNNELFRIGDAMRARFGGGPRRPPDYFSHLYLTGARTIVLQPDDPELERLHEPWKTSGILLAPIVHGFDTTFFPYRR